VTAPKKKAVLLPKILRADTDFLYLRELPSVISRIAAFYEYARESAELKEIISATRKAGMFRAGFTADIPPELLQRLSALSSLLPIDQLLVLHDCNGFPEKAFRDVRQNLEILKHYDSFGVNHVGTIPWRVLILLRRTYTSAGLTELEYWTSWTSERQGRTLHAISIPWKYTNAELTQSFNRLIGKIRPAQFPEPKRAGRKGRSSGSGAIDMLHQLAAFRLNRAGFSFDRAGQFTPYVSKRGWAKAIIAAEERIKHMTRCPFFGSASQTKSGNK